jgi:hypothetical protein
VPAPEWLTLCWNGQPLGRITEVRLYDWPWVCGRLAVGDWPPALRASVEALARAADSDGELPDPPFQSGHYDGWTVVDPGGATTEIMVPKVDFRTGDIEWR